MEGFDIFIMVLAFFATMMVIASKNSKKKQQQSRKTGHPGYPSRPAKPNSPKDALEELRRLLEDADERSSQVEEGVETYVEPDSLVVTPIEFGADEGIRSTVAEKDERYSLEKEQNEAASGAKLEIDPRNLIIYSEIMHPKWEGY